MADVERRVEGLSELKRALDQLPQRLSRNIIRYALRKGAEVMMADLGARIVAITRTGRLAKSARIKVRFKQGQPEVTLGVGSSKAYYAHFIERGTKPHLIRAKGDKSMFINGRYARVVRHPGTRAQFPVKKTYEQKGMAGVTTFRRVIMERIGKEWNASQGGRRLR